MFSVDHVLVSDDLLDARFVCDLAACKGACCVAGDAGAPVREDERAHLDAAVAVVHHLLPPASQRRIAERGAWEETAPGVYHTTCVDGPRGPGACVFVAYERGIATCSIEKQYRAGKTDWVKPLSCHLYPLRIQSFGDPASPDALDVVNYEQISLCDPARRCGTRSATYLSDFLEGPLTRAYGPDWYSRFREVLAERRDALGVPGTAHAPARAADPGVPVRRLPS